VGDGDGDGDGLAVARAVTEFVGVCRMDIICCELTNKSKVWTINLRIGQ
jgi:hypothetical protein